MFPKKGKFFPDEKGSQQLGYQLAVAAALRAELGDTHQAAKTLLRWTSANERTVKNWLSSANGPRGEHLVELARHSDQVLNAFLRLAGRSPIIAAVNILGARNKLSETVSALDLLLNRRAENPAKSL